MAKKAKIRTITKTVVKKVGRKIGKDNFANFGKGLLAGTGGGEIAGTGLAMIDAPGVISVPVRIGASAVSGYYAGGKSLGGLLGGLTGELFTAALQWWSGRSDTGRLRGI